MRIILAAIALGAASSASAHVVLAPADATAASYNAGEFRVGHGCGNAATTAVRVEIPEAIPVARARPKPGWTIEVERAPLPAPVISEGKEQRDRVAAITWRGNLPADQFDGFGIMLKLPSGPTAPLPISVRQSCGSVTVDWNELPKAGIGRGELKYPAPVLTIGSAQPSLAH